MKSTRKKRKSPSQQALVDQVQKILEERGSEALEMARQAVLEEKIECKEVREALHYFMTEYWHDLARPALLSLCCEAVGGDPNATVPIAIPLSLISGGMDIHDDIIDLSKVKEGRPTVYGKFGKEIALLIGDALLFKGLNLLYETKIFFHEKMLRIMGVVKDTFFELGESEALELRFRGRLDMTPEEYLAMVKMRAANVEAHTCIGAIVGGGTKMEVKTLSEYGRVLGTLLIIRDDFVDMFEKEELLHRIDFECLPLPLLYALQNPKVEKEILPMLKKEERFDLTTILEIVLRSRKVKNLKRLITRMVKNEMLHLDRLKIREPTYANLKLFLLAAKEGL